MEVEQQQHLSSASNHCLTDHHHHHHTATQHAHQSLADLDDSVLIQILAWLPDPHPLAATCSTLHAASTTSICRQLWFQRWYLLHPTASKRPLVLAALSWRGLAAAAPAQHGAPKEDSNSTACLARFLASTLHHLLDAQQQQQQQQGQQGTKQLPYQLPKEVSTKDVSRAAAHKAEQHVQLIQQLTPWSQHLLIPAAAAAATSNYLLLQQLLAPPVDCTPADASSASAGTSSSRSTTNTNGGDGVRRLQQWLWQQPVQAPGNLQQHHKRRVCWRQLVQPLPDFAGLQAFRHNVLQTSLAAAAKAGAADCLQLLLGELVTCGASVWDCAEALTAVAEAAAAAGHLNCLELVWSALLPHAGGPSCSLVSSNAPLPPQQQQQVDGLVHAMDQINLQQQQQPPVDRLAEALQLSLQLAVTAGDHSQQQHQHAALPALQLVGSSTYLLVAAAGSGRCEVVAAVMTRTPAHTQKQQLPAALAAAGQRGHVAVLQLLLQHPQLSARPLQLAASDAAVHGWPHSTLLPLLDTLASQYHQELVQLLAKPLIQALQHQQQAVASAMLTVLAEDAALDQADLLSEALLLLAYQGQADWVAWIIQVAPTVLVKLGARAAAAALEGGHPRLAQLILDRGGVRPAAFKAAARRGQLTAAVAAGDLQAVRELLQEVSLPLVWSCEALPVGGQGGALAAAAGTSQGTYAAGNLGGGAGAAGAGVGGAAGAAAARRQTQPTHCLLTLLQTAALSPTPAGPSGVEILRLLLGVLADNTFEGGQSSERQHVLMALAKACFAAGRVEQLLLVVEAAGRPRVGQRRSFMRELRSQLQLPHAAAVNTTCDHLQQGGGGSSSSGGGAVAAALALMDQPTCSDMVSSLLAQSYFAVCMPGEYLGGAARPMQPAAHIPCLSAFTELLLVLAERPELPPGARCRDLPLFRLLVRTVLQSADVYLLHALLLFLQRHGSAVMADMPGDALRALRVEAEAAAQAASEAAGEAQMV